MPNPKRPTQSDVARLAGVSRATVSFVLNDATATIPISDETRQRVLEAARQLNYTPDPVAQMLAHGSSNMIGVFTYEQSFPLERSDFYYEFIQGIERAAAQHNFNVLLFTRNSVEGQRRRVYAGGINSLRMAEGTVFLGVSPDKAELARLAQENYPFVYIGRREVPGVNIDWVAMDYIPAAYEATRHLLQLNHRRILYAGVDNQAEPNQDKLLGVRRAIQEVKNAELTILAEPELANREVFLEAARKTSCTAIICSYSYTFDLVVDYLQQARLAIPQDYSVIGLGDVNTLRCWPVAPTFVSSDRQDAGEQAVHLLVSRIRGEVESPQHKLLPWRLIKGESAVWNTQPDGGEAER